MDRNTHVLSSTTFTEKKWYNWEIWWLLGPHFLRLQAKSESIAAKVILYSILWLLFFVFTIFIFVFVCLYFFPLIFLKNSLFESSSNLWFLLSILLFWYYRFLGVEGRHGEIVCGESRREDLQLQTLPDSSCALWRHHFQGCLWSLFSLWSLYLVSFIFDFT